MKTSTKKKAAKRPSKDALDYAQFFTPNTGAVRTLEGQAFRRVGSFDYSIKTFVSNSSC